MSRILGMRGTRLNEARPGTGKERGGGRAEDILNGRRMKIRGGTMSG